MTTPDSMENDFRLWMKTMGFNSREVAKAGALIGLSKQTAGHRNRGEVQVSETERLAMSAVVAGLPAWEPKTAAEVDLVGRIIKLARQIAASGNRTPEA